MPLTPLTLSERPATADSATSALTTSIFISALRGTFRSSVVSPMCESAPQLNQPCLSGGSTLIVRLDPLPSIASFFAPSPSVPVIETSFLSQPLTVTSPLMFETSMRASALTLRVSLIGEPAAAAPETASSSNSAEWRAVRFIGRRGSVSRLLRRAARFSCVVRWCGSEG